VVWHGGDGEPLETAGGAMVSSLRQGFVLQAKRPGPALNPATIASTLGIALATPALTPPPRNRPCPCGSGTKAKHCCWS
jgi:uncharacterized protein YecA (UPF0149 family)